MEKPKREYKATITTENGIPKVVIKCIAEERVYPDGRKDVTIFAPNLSLINKEVSPNRR